MVIDALDPDVERQKAARVPEVFPTTAEFP
jgi:hypothetical protein